MEKGNMKELVTRVSKELGVSIKEAKKIVETVFSSIEESVFGESKKLAVTGRFTISVYERKSRFYRHPKTKEKVHSPSHKALRLTIGESWKKRLTTSNKKE